MEKGNLIWYNAVPIALWNEVEQFQDVQGLQTVTINNGKATYVPVRALDTSAGGNITFAPPSVPFTLYPPTALSPTVIPWREPVRALGSAFKPGFNYKREIVGHLRSGVRCYVCLDIKDGPVKPVRFREWGLLWCSSCFAQHTITPSAVSMLPDKDLVLASVTLRSVRFSTTPRYFLPEIDDIVRQVTGIDLKTHALIMKKCRSFLEANRVHKSAIEARRRDIRLAIIEFAKMIWDGEDPAPDLIPENGGVSFRGRPHLSSPDTYRLFRERFAPTAELGKFLFAHYLVAAEPRESPYDLFTGWLTDPTKSLPRTTTVGDLTHRWISGAAESMLSHLTCFRDSRYITKGFGGSVGIWVKAALDWHTRRLETEIDSGYIVSIGWAQASTHGTPQFRRIRRLRFKCGLQGAGGLLRPIPNRVEVDDFSTPLTLEQYIALDRYAVTAAEDQMQQVKDFNKIIKRTCVACPQTSLLLYPMGIEGLLQHMMHSHLRRFWTTDDFHIVG
ncbi:hypothetical protein MMC13_007887 [Lambiella insularis]|nr:hypothetical protein [Lambiella insularis]